MIIPRSIVLPDQIEKMGKERGRTKIRLTVELYDHKQQRYRYVKGGAWTANIKPDQGGVLEAGITKLVAAVEKKI